MNDLKIVIGDFLGRIHESLLLIPIPLFAFEIFILIWWLKFIFHKDTNQDVFDMVYKQLELY